VDLFLVVRIDNECLSTGNTLGSQWTDHSVSYMYVQLHRYACGVQVWSTWTMVDD
jgi:hypothetical protein